MILFGVAPIIIQQQNPYPIFETDKIGAKELKARRVALLKQLEPGSIAIFFSNPTRNRNNDVDYQYRGDSNFLYLTGYEEPDGALVLIPGGVTVNGKTVHEVLFTEEPDPASLTWLGYRMGAANAVPMLGMDAAFPNKEFTRMLPSLAVAATAKNYSLSIPPDESGWERATSAMAVKWLDTNGFTKGRNVGRLVLSAREIKSPAEIALIKKACEISARAHIEAMRTAEPGMREWEIGSLVKYMFGREGCEYEGYPPICGSGPNSTILHYEPNRGPMNAGDVMCMDTAGEFHGYSADVTRSFPITGKWTRPQRDIYEVVLRAQSAGIELCRKGVDQGQVGAACAKELADGLIRLGIIKEAGELGRYYMHGFGHGIGLDVHDPLSRVLQPGNCLTVEPGIYIKEGSPCDRKYWNIGIRIEDDILVTDGDPVIMSGAAPRDPDAIERLMAEKGIGNIKQAPYGG